MPRSPSDAAAVDPLAAWNEGAAKTSILDFVARVTRLGGNDYVPPEKRIATFDNDGTLWVEQPYPSQVAFALDLVKAKASQHPEWQEKEPFKSVLAGDVKGIFSGGLPALAEIVIATHSGLSTDDFEAVARAWIEKTRHPKTNKLFTEMVLPADARVAGLSPGQRLQDLHRVGRRRRIHAHFRRGDLRRAA
jgi:haloacid dehalogenase-like hydrolase